MHSVRNRRRRRGRPGAGAGDPAARPRLRGNERACVQVTVIAMEISDLQWKWSGLRFIMMEENLNGGKDPETCA